MRVAIKHNKRQSGFISAHQHARGREVRLVRELVRSPGRGQSCAISDETHRLDERLVRELVQSPAERRVRQHQRPALEELGETHLDGELIGDAGARLRALAALEGLRVDRRRLIWEAITGHQQPSYLDCGPITRRRSACLWRRSGLEPRGKPDEGGNRRYSSRNQDAQSHSGAAVSSHVANRLASIAMPPLPSASVAAKAANANAARLGSTSLSAYASPE